MYIFGILAFWKTWRLSGSSKTEKHEKILTLNCLVSILQSKIGRYVNSVFALKSEIISKIFANVQRLKRKTGSEIWTTSCFDLTRFIFIISFGSSKVFRTKPFQRITSVLNSPTKGMMRKHNEIVDRENFVRSIV